MMDIQTEIRKDKKFFRNCYIILTCMLLFVVIMIAMPTERYVKNTVAAQVALTNDSKLFLGQIIWEAVDGREIIFETDSVYDTVEEALEAVRKIINK